MKHICRALAVWTGAAILMGTAAALPVHAEDTEADIVYFDTACPGFDPIYDDEIIVQTEFDQPLTVVIVQHSPERENLLLYDCSFVPSADCYVFRAEPGDYTAYITVDAVQNSAVKRTFSQDFTIDNPDFVTPDETFFTKTQYCFSLSLTAVSGDDDTEPESMELNGGVNSDATYQIVHTVNFKQYNRFRGDFDGDGETDITDAQRTLNEYAASLAGVASDSPANAEQIAACDIDGDGELSVIDAQHILSFYTMCVSGLRPFWFDGYFDLRYPAVPD